MTHLPATSYCANPEKTRYDDVCNKWILSASDQGTPLHQHDQADFFFFDLTIHARTINLERFAAFATDNIKLDA
jgi:hypothetical protein